MRIVAALLGVWLVCPWPGSAATVREVQDKLQQYRQNISQEKKDLNAVRQRIRLEKKVVRKQKKQERSILFDIQRIGQKIEEAEDHHQEQLKNLRLVRTTIARLSYDIQTTETEIQRLRGYLAARLRLLYRERTQGFWRVLLTSQTLSQGLTRLKFFHVLAAQNADFIRRLAVQHNQLLTKHVEMQKREHQARELEAESKQTLAKIKIHRASRQKILKRVRRKRNEHERAVKELTVASQKLTKLIRMLEQRARKLKRRIAQYGKAFATRKHSLPWPTRGRVVTRYGKTKHPRFNTYIYNKGIDIAGSIGQNVISVTRGEVLFAEWFEGFGRMVILDHGGGYNTIYAHLKKILVSEGNTVKEGQVIGQLGDSGTWKGPDLYFEIRKRGKALNPLAWLEE